MVLNFFHFNMFKESDLKLYYNILITPIQYSFNLKLPSGYGPNFPTIIPLHSFGLMVR